MNQNLLGIVDIFYGTFSYDLKSKKLLEISKTVYYSIKLLGNGLVALGKYDGPYSVDLWNLTNQTFILSLSGHNGLITAIETF